jgi:hypothetical protein
MGFWGRFSLHIFKSGPKIFLNFRLEARPLVRKRDHFLDFRHRLLTGFLLQPILRLEPSSWFVSRHHMRLGEESLMWVPRLAEIWASHKLNFWLTFDGACRGQEVLWAKACLLAALELRELLFKHLVFSLEFLFLVEDLVDLSRHLGWRPLVLVAGDRFLALSTGFLRWVEIKIASILGTSEALAVWPWETFHVKVGVSGLHHSFN